ncbi:hypothetical protein GCM10023194_57190 [Planotetraspora phitsanulokensis]|uniref:Uncharacterized protein n=1 Tax=Planotetraspora phitsanulokensis TaxID=575192 RepID=A0A8J3UEL5_9ACTN|nr:hypothetical protein Pph01_80790 [Planotetraspora phitsanulokensis]
MPEFGRGEGLGDALNDADVASAWQLARPLPRCVRMPYQCHRGTAVRSELDEKPALICGKQVRPKHNDVPDTFR